MNQSLSSIESTRGEYVRYSQPIFPTLKKHVRYSRHLSLQYEGISSSRKPRFIIHATIRSPKTNRCRKENKSIASEHDLHSISTILTARYRQDKTNNSNFIRNSVEETANPQRSHNDNTDLRRDQSLSKSFINNDSSLSTNHNKTINKQELWSNTKEFYENSISNKKKKKRYLGAYPCPYQCSCLLTSLLAALLLGIAIAAVLMATLIKPITTINESTTISTITTQSTIVLTTTITPTTTSGSTTTSMTTSSTTTTETITTETTTTSTITTSTTTTSTETTTTSATTTETTTTSMTTTETTTSTITTTTTETTTTSTTTIELTTSSTTTELTTTLTIITTSTTTTESTTTSTTTISTTTSTITISTTTSITTISTTTSTTTISTRTSTTTTVSTTASTTVATTVSCAVLPNATESYVNWPNTYTQKTYNYTALFTGVGVLEFGFTSQNGNDQWYLDDVSIIDINASNTEMLINGDFENGTLIGWQLLCTSNCMSDSGIISSSSTHKGLYRYKDACKKKYDFLRQTFSKTIGHIYSISFWFKTDSHGGQEAFFRIN